MDGPAVLEHNHSYALFAHDTRLAVHFIKPKGEDG